ncbi:uracil-DNA glycosylase [Carnobacteriaceae bacterium zg-ZUI252]|nr:uracil-DNA glycosylase [Carnobacteriaceae bacterium zg-ZUI252]MBS4770192.1 uracil-DNA glycosylase [Carnobacteriaceae bacterium zg-ZUI240]
MIHNWQAFIEQERLQPYYVKLMHEVNQRRILGNVFPPENQLFNAFDMTPLEQVKVVILGQDPYHQKGQANGLSFSVNKGVKLPPSLRNMFIELADDIGCDVSTHGDLTHWAKQGVLLLNTVLSVDEGKANSHKNLGWETFTDNAIRLLNEQERSIVFVLWGAQAQKKQTLITNSKHYIVQSPHPSPLSSYRGFFGSRPYSTVNHYLTASNQQPIDWAIKEN